MQVVFEFENSEKFTEYFDHSNIFRKVLVVWDKEFLASQKNHKTFIWMKIYWRDFNHYPFEFTEISFLSFSLPSKYFQYSLQTKFPLTQILSETTRFHLKYDFSFRTAKCSHLNPSLSFHTHNTIASVWIKHWYWIFCDLFKRKYRKLLANFEKFFRCYFCLNLHLNALEWESFGELQ